MLSIPHLSRTTERRRGANAVANAPVAAPRNQRPLLRASQVPIALTLEPSSNQLAVLPVASSATPPTRQLQQLRKVRRKSKNCRNLSRYGHEYGGFRRTTTRETMIHADLEDIYHQIWELEQKRILIQSIQLVRHADAAGLVADKVRDYYSHFRRGYDPTKCTDGGQFLQSLLRSIMLDDVKSPAFDDLDTFLFQWENYSRYHAKVVLVVDSIQPLESEDPTEYVVKVQGLSTLTISRDTIKHFFKPIMEDEAMVQQLIGKEYIFSFVTMFYFNLDGRIFKMEPRADLAAGLFNLVSDPFSTVKLLGASKLTDDGCLHAYNDPETPQFEVLSS
ncbi:hypothetical protein FI667_g2782, partial [Globisporangium splendens]